MRLIFHGQQAFGKAVLEKILEKGADDVVAIYCAPDKGSRIDPLKEYAQEKGLSLYQPGTYKDEKVWEQMRSHDADLCVMAYVTLFVPEEALNVPRFGSIQYHPSLLPDHKGPSSINWPIIFGKKKTGLSIFRPDNGLDTGPIILQKEVDIQPDDTLGSLYFNHLFPMGVDAMMEGIEMVRADNPQGVAQDANAGSYEGWCRKQDARIDWSKPVDDVYNLIRGTNPQPGAWTTVDGAELKIFNCVKNNDTADSPGTVCVVSDDGFSVAAKDGNIHVQRVKPADGAKVSAADYVSQTGLSVGDQLGS